MVDTKGLILSNFINNLFDRLNVWLVFNVATNLLSGKSFEGHLLNEIFTSKTYLRTTTNFKIYFMFSWQKWKPINFGLELENSKSAGRDKLCKDGRWGKGVFSSFV